MAIFDKPDFERMLQNADWPRLIHYANYTKDPELSREAMKVATRDPYKLVEYLYETALWTQKNSSSRGKRLPRRGVPADQRSHRAAATTRLQGRHAARRLCERL